jgi:signal transduction histidine kinase
MIKDFYKKEIESLVKLSSLINSSLDIVEVLDNSMHVTEELMDAEASSIFEVDFEKNELFFRLVRGGSISRAKEIRIKMGEGIAGRVASSGEPLIVWDTEKDNRFINKVDLLTGFKTRSIIALPIKNRGRIIGVLEVLNIRDPLSFDSKDLEVLMIVTNQIGVAIENARLYARLKEKFALTRDELRESQSRLIQSERLAALGKLSQGIAHAVRNPVMIIGGFAKRIKKKLILDGSTTGYIDLILDETERLETLVKDVWKYTSMSEPEFKPVKISALLQRALAGWRMKPGSESIKIEENLNAEDPLVFVDEELMAMALIHVMENAQEAIPGEGTIAISTWWEDKWMVISVRDKGQGINSHDLPLVFDPFFSTKTDGMGLGLSIVNRIVSGHRGEVKILSKPGDGTEVRIQFPPHPEIEGLTVNSKR